MQSKLFLLITIVLVDISNGLEIAKLSDVQNPTPPGQIFVIRDASQNGRQENLFGPIWAPYNFIIKQFAALTATTDGSKDTEKTEPAPVPAPEAAGDLRQFETPTLDFLINPKQDGKAPEKSFINKGKPFFTPLALNATFTLSKGNWSSGAAPPQNPPPESWGPPQGSWSPPPGSWSPGPEPFPEWSKAVLSINQSEKAPDAPLKSFIDKGKPFFQPIAFNATFIISKGNWSNGATPPPKPPPESWGPPQGSWSPPPGSWSPKPEPFPEWSKSVNQAEKAPDAPLKSFFDKPFFQPISFDAQYSVSNGKNESVEVVVVQPSGEDVCKYMCRGKGPSVTLVGLACYCDCPLFAHHYERPQPLCPQHQHSDYSNNYGSECHEHCRNLYPSNCPGPAGSCKHGVCTCKCNPCDTYPPDSDQKKSLA